MLAAKKKPYVADNLAIPAEVTAFFASEATLESVEKAEDSILTRRYVSV